MTLLNIFANNLLPIFLVAGVGFLLGHKLHVEPKSISRLVFYVFSPCLIFDLLTSSSLGDGEVLRMMLFTLTVLAVIGALAWGLGNLLRLERRLLAAVVMTSLFVNAGNYGLPLTQFAFGQDALAYASLFFITNAILAYTVGAVIASLGERSLLESLLGLVKLPAVYAVVLAIVFYHFDWTLPLPLQRSVELMGQGSIPAMLILLGLQFQAARWGGQRPALALANGLRLIVSPLIAFLLAALYGLQGPARQAGVVEAAMPTAILTTVLATEFDLEPSFVSIVVFSSTVLSILTLTPLLAYLGA